MVVRDKEKIKFKVTFLEIMVSDIAHILILKITLSILNFIMWNILCLLQTYTYSIYILFLFDFCPVFLHLRSEKQ